MAHLSYNIKSGLLFPIQFLFLGYVFLLGGVMIVIENIWLSPFLILAGLFIVSAYGGVEFRKGEYRTYSAFIFIKFGKWKSVGEVEKIFIKGIKTSQKFYGRANQSSVIKNYIYKAFLKFENGESVFLYENKNKKKMDNKVREINDQLKTEVFDYSC